MKRILMLVVLLTPVGFAGLANADLTVIGTATYGGNHYKLIYEGELGGSGLVWLDYTNVIVNHGDDNYWQLHKQWAENLGGSLTVTLYEGYRGTWSSGWRLPITDESKEDLIGPWSSDSNVGDGTGFGWGGPDINGSYDYRAGYNMTNSEMGHLYYVTLNNNGYIATDGATQSFEPVHLGPFTNLQHFYYWSSMTAAPPPQDESPCTFNFSDGSAARYGSIDYTVYAIGVRSAEVSTVPVPASVLLLSSGIAGLAAFRRRFRRAIIHLM
jgi:hypothetical protein